MRRPFLVASLLCAASACGGQAAPKKPMGLLPNATTTAEPEWLPFAIRSGSSAPSDERERHLTELRKLTEGWLVDRCAFSPDVTELAVVATAPGAKAPSLFLVPLGSGSPRRVSSEGERVVGLTASTSRPWRVVYWVAQDGATSLVELGPTGDRRALPIGGVKARAAALSPDGSTLYVVGEDKHDRGVFFATAGKEPSLLVGDKGAAPFLTVSTDRSYLAWPTEEAGRRQIVLASIEGRGARPIVSGAGATPTFLAGTRRLLFASDVEVQEREIYSIDLATEGARPERVTFSQADSPAASPDGALVAFASSRAGSGRDLYVARWVDDP